MKRAILLAIALYGGMISAQADSTVFQRFKADKANPSDTAWKVGGNFGLQFTQASYSNWQAGGANSFSGNALFSSFANYDNGGKWKWYNSLILAYGLNFQEELTIKTDDRIELESRVDRTISKNWNASALLNFRTQFDEGFEEPGDSNRISTFLAPAYTLLGLGFTYKPNKAFSAFLSPATAKFTLVNDQVLANRGAYGVDAGVFDSLQNRYTTLGSKTRFEIGAYANLNYKQEILKNVTLQSRIDFYMNYLNDDFYNFVDVNGEVILFLKVNDYITANLAVNFIYDDDILFDTNGDGNGNAPRTQFKQVLGVGFAYNFGDKLKKK